VSPTASFAAVTDGFVLARLLGDVARKRVLELGCGDGARAVELAAAGATVIAVDPDAATVLTARQRAEQSEVRIEAHTGDLADLAFLRGDSVDLAFSEDALDTVADLDRVFRQVQRVLRPSAWFAFTLPHPFGSLVATDPEPAGALPLERPYVTRSYFDDDPVGATRPYRIGELFARLGRAGFQVDTIGEPEPTGDAPGRALAPATIIWRARKIGS
jgi:SAM-dependent methyltransferase